MPVRHSQRQAVGHLGLAVDGPAAEAGVGWRSERCRLTLDPDGWQAHWSGEAISLTVTEFGILRTLAGMPSRVFSRDAIIDRLRGPGFAVTDRTIDSHIRNLRAKFGQAGAGDIIETRPGIGYRIGACGSG